MEKKRLSLLFSNKIKQIGTYFETPLDEKVA